MSLFQTGVYCWYNQRNKKRYVGSASRSFSRRKQDHLSELGRGKSPCTYLQHAWNKYGEEAFIFKILEYCSPDKCLEREQYWIDYFRSADPHYGYNVNPIAGSPLGRRWKRKTPRPPATEETRQRLAEAGRGKKHTEETKEKMRASAIGKNRGRKLTEEHKAKINWKGKRHKEETKALISAALQGKVVSEETKRRMSEAARNKPPDTEETRAKKSEAAKLRWVRRKLKQQQSLGV